MNGMKVGDIGILQRIPSDDNVSYLNGSPAEVLEILDKGTAVNLGVDSGVLTRSAYGVRDVKGGQILIGKHQIRPLSDPDAELSKEDKRELVE